MSSQLYCGLLPKDLNPVVGRFLSLSTFSTYLYGYRCNLSILVAVYFDYFSCRNLLYAIDICPTEP